MFDRTEKTLHFRLFLAYQLQIPWTTFETCYLQCALTRDKTITKAIARLFPLMKEQLLESTSLPLNLVGKETTSVKQCEWLCIDELANNDDFDLPVSLTANLEELLYLVGMKKTVMYHGFPLEKADTVCKVWTSYKRGLGLPIAVAHRGNMCQNKLESAFWGDSTPGINNTLPRIITEAQPGISIEMVHDVVWMESEIIHREDLSALWFWLQSPKPLEHCPFLKTYSFEHGKQRKKESLRGLNLKVPIDNGQDLKAESVFDYYLNERIKFDF